MDALRANIGAFAEAMTDSGNPDRVRDWRAAVAWYRDAAIDGPDWFGLHPFVTDVAALKAQLQTIEARGGGDEPESLLDAIFKVSCLEATAKGADAEPTKWRYRSSAKRFVVVFTDATMHRTMVIPEAAGGLSRDVINKIHEQKLQLHLFAPDNECFEELSSADKANWYMIPGPDFVAGMIAYTSDLHGNFRKVIEALGRSLSTSCALPSEMLEVL
jgi:hypothetical protein